MPRTQQEPWRRLAIQQSGLLTRRQLAEVGVDRWAVAHHIKAERWQEVASDVIATTTGELTDRQRRWAAVLHGGDGAVLSGIAALEEAGLQRWARPDIEVLIPYASSLPRSRPGVIYRRTTRNLALLRQRGVDLPRLKTEPSALLFAARERSERSAVGLLAAVNQQHLTSPALLLECLSDLAPLRRAKTMRVVLEEIAGGAQSLGEIDIKRMCSKHRIAAPRRQVRRRDSGGRQRFTDCEWVLAGGRALILEVDGSFHMDAEQWEDDLARQRGLSAPDRLIVRCTTRELRDQPELVARDLIALGVPRTVLSK